MATAQRRAEVVLRLLLSALTMCCSGQAVTPATSLSSAISSALSVPALHLELPRAFADTPRTSPKPEIQPFHIVLPVNGSANTLPLNVRCEIAVDDIDSGEFFRRYGDHLICLEIDKLWEQCSPLQAVSPLLSHLSPGEHSVVAYLVEKNNSLSGSSERFLESDPVTFSVLFDRNFPTHVERTKRCQQRAPNQDLGLLEWLSSQEKDSTEDQLADNVEPQDFARTTEYISSNTSDASQRESPPPVLVIGVKTSTLYGFASRQAIRDTWARKKSLETYGIYVYFIGCQPVIAEDRHQAQREALIRAIEVEKLEFGDLLTSELECEDSYFTLPSKVKEFLHFAARKFPQVPYVMIADDDIYLRVDQLTQALRDHGPRTQFYAGQVWAEQYQRAAPIRDPNNKNQIPEAQYPMSELPPYASGPHYFMSMDCAEYIGRNRDALVGLAASDDVSVGLWLLALQVHPEHVAPFQNLRDESCSDDLVSLADLTPFAIRLVHENLEAGSPFCQGFDVMAWLKPNQAGLKLDFKRKVNLDVHVQLSSVFLHVVTEVMLEYGVATKRFLFSPAEGGFRDHSTQVCRYLNKIQIYTYDCGDIAMQLHSAMVEKLNKLAEKKATGYSFNTAYLVLWRHNLQFALLPDSEIPRPVIIAYSPYGKHGLVYLASVFVVMYPQNPIKVLDEPTFRRKQHAKEQGLPSSPDVVVLSSGDGDCWDGWYPVCRQLAADVLQRYGNSSSLIMISNEPWSVDGLDERVLLVSTLSEISREKYV
ncbi:hypothetical protein Gpo141_00013579 [Globisporangium polare]